jgi:hypothetical protein
MKLLDIVLAALLPAAALAAPAPAAPAPAAPFTVTGSSPGTDTGLPEQEPSPESPEPGEAGDSPLVDGAGGAPFGFGGWFHIGGGAGAVIGARKVHPVGRFTVGFGGYLFLVYGGLSAEVSVSQHLDFVAAGVAYAGLALPIPVVRPLLGFKGGGGVHVEQGYGPSPAITLGPQLGVHIGQIGGSRFGIRVMVDAEATVSTKHRMAGFGVVGTLGLML